MLGKLPENEEYVPANQDIPKYTIHTFTSVWYSRILKIHIVISAWRKQKYSHKI